MEFFKDRGELTLLPKQTFSFDADDLSKSFTLTGRGLMHSMTLKCPNFTNVVTTTLTITNADGIEIYNSGALAENTTHVLSQLWEKLPIVGEHTVTATLSGVAGGTGGDVELSMYLI